MASECSLTITGDEPVFFLAGMTKQFTIRKWEGRMGWLGRSPACLVASMIGVRMYTISWMLAGANSVLTLSPEDAQGCRAGSLVK